MRYKVIGDRNSAFPIDIVKTDSPLEEQQSELAQSALDIINDDNVDETVKGKLSDDISARTGVKGSTIYDVKKKLGSFTKPLKNVIKDKVVEPNDPSDDLQVVEPEVVKEHPIDDLDLPRDD